MSAASGFILVIGAHYWTAIAFVTVLSLGEAIWSPSVYTYTMMLAPTGREGLYVAHDDVCAKVLDSPQPCHGLASVCVSWSQIRRPCERTHVCRQTLCGWTVWCLALQLLPRGSFRLLLASALAVWAPSDVRCVACDSYRPATAAAT